MNTFFDQATRDQLEERLNKLTAQASGQWGKMNVAQMLAHCTASMQVPVGDLQLKRSAMGLIGWMFKGMIRSDKPFARNSPTAAEFVIRDERSFDSEKRRFVEAFRKMAQGSSVVACHNHPFFGSMSDEDWGCLVYKHLDHHFRQFGV